MFLTCVVAVEGLAVEFNRGEGSAPLDEAEVPVPIDVICDLLRHTSRVRLSSCRDLDVTAIHDLLPCRRYQATTRRLLL